VFILLLCPTLQSVFLKLTSSVPHSGAKALTKPIATVVNRSLVYSPFQYFAELFKPSWWHAQGGALR
jgi:hypothetical protein